MEAAVELSGNLVNVKTWLLNVARAIHQDEIRL
jgi:hypothetical protein